MSEECEDVKFIPDAKPNAPERKRKRQESAVAEAPLIVPFHIGGELRNIPQASFLSHIWNSGLDSPCELCAEPFHPDGDALIRTIGLEQAGTSLPSVIDITQNPVSPWNLRIFNRHFSCVKAKKINYVPISHAWHENVAAAQDLGFENLEVARLVYQTPVKTLLALSAIFPDPEIWHDYLSVPQWRPDVQERLLLAIPEIYSHATKTVIHLDDVKAVNLSDHAKNSPYEKFITDFSAVIRSRWFDRMWVTLEYLQSNDVMILTEDYTTCDSNARELCRRLDASHSKWVKQRSSSDVTQDIWKQNTTLKRMTSWIDMEAWKNEPDMHRTLGWAIGILGHRQCRHSKDYFLALGKMLRFLPEQDPLVLVKDRFRYFFSLAIHALRQGDYTPLFFIPSPDEKSDPRAPWLRGYSLMTWKLWDMGRCHRKATDGDIIDNDKVQPRLQTVGILEWFEYYDFVGDPESVVDHVASRIVRASGRDPQALCDAVDRVFPLDEKKALYMEWRDANGEDSSSSTPRYDLAKVKGLLEEYGTLLDHRGGEAVIQQRLGVAKKLGNTLKLGRRGKYLRESRLETAAGEADWFLREYGKAMEGIGRVSCNICGRRSIFRLTLWEEPAPEAAHVYRIPELLYDDTVPEGVGIVVEGERIVGKMMYGTPACACVRLEVVELGPATL